MGGNFEEFEVNIHKTTGTYNPAGAIFHDRFSTTGPGNTQSFYVVKPDGSRREISAYVNSKTGNIWYMNRGLQILTYPMVNISHLSKSLQPPRPQKS